MGTNQALGRTPEHTEIEYRYLRFFSEQEKSKSFTDEDNKLDFGHYSFCAKHPAASERQRIARRNADLYAKDTCLFPQKAQVCKLNALGNYEGLVKEESNEDGENTCPCFSWRLSGFIQ